MVDYPTNEFTQMIAQVAAGNRSGVRAGGVASATPLPTVHSADLGKEVSADQGMSLEERQYLDQLARDAGIKDERLGTAQPESEGLYATLEDAIAAGASVHQPPSDIPTPPMLQTHGTYKPEPNRMSAREFIGRSVTVQVPRLPDFRKVEGIDLVNNRVILDGMDFPITDEEANEFKQFVVGKAHSAITDRLNEAVGLFASAVTPEVLDGVSTNAEGAAAPLQQLGEGSSKEPSL